MQFSIAKITVIGCHASISKSNEYSASDMCVVRCLEMGRRPRYLLKLQYVWIAPFIWHAYAGESQPVYDEFGSILLLVLAFKYRYNLSPYDLGVSDTNSFVFRLLEHGSTSRRLEDLTETQNKNLGAWVTALFIAEGISDESMSSCSPQEFYLLVATLFSQSFSACEAGKLEFDTLKGGFECRSNSNATGICIR